MQKNKFRSAALAVVLSFFSLYPSTIFSQNFEPPSIIITEIAAFEASDTEWLEIYNNGSTSLDLAGWKFFEDQSNHGLSLTQGSSTLQVGEFAVIANKAENFAQKYPDYAGTIFDSSWSSLKEDGEEIGLKDSSGALTDFFTYPSSQSQTSLERIDAARSGNEATNWRNHPHTHSLGMLTLIESSSLNNEEAENVATEISQNSPPLPLPPPTQTTNRAPQATIEIQSGALMAQNSTTINFDGRASTDPDGDVLTYIWDMGDGAMETTANPGPHTYNKPGTYVARLTVVDSYGASSEMHKYVTVLMQPEAPVAPAPKPLANTAAPKTATSTATSISQENKTEKTNPLALDSLFTIPDTQLQLRGYFVFIPSGSVVAKTSAVKKKKSTTNTAKAKSKSPTSTAKKSFANGDLSTAVQITEIFPAPVTGQEEWIEIYNASDTPVNLGNWQLVDGSKKSPFLIPDTIFLEAHAYHFFLKSETKIALNNGGDSLELHDFEGTLIDTVSYEKAKTDASFARTTIEGKIQWQWDTQKTPGAPNPQFSKLNGVVKELQISEDPDLLSAIEVELPTGTSTTVYFSGDTLDPLIAQVTMKKGTSVSLLTRARRDNLRELAEISAIREPRLQEIPENPSLSPWLVWFILASTGLIAYGLHRLYSTYFHKYKNEEPETAAVQQHY